MVGVLERVVALGAATLAAGLALLAPQQPGVSGEHATLAVTTLRPFDAAPLYPGGPASESELRIRYDGVQPAAVRLQLAGLRPVAAAEASPCRAPDPAAQFVLTVASADVSFFRRALADVPAAGVAIPGGRGDGRWSPGQSRVVRLAISLPRSAGNADMNCSLRAKFTWTAE
jgi:hypothetical protein